MDEGIDQQLLDRVDSLMLTVPEGEEIIRDFRDEQKWISSDSTMSIPGKKGNLVKHETRMRIPTFALARIPVTEALYVAILDGGVRSEAFPDAGVRGEAVPDAGGSGDVNVGVASAETPMVNVSWLEAIRFCNRLSVRCGLPECYVIEPDGSSVRWDESATGYRLPTDAEWQYACRAGTVGYRYGALTDIGWYQANSEGHIHPGGEKAPNPWGLSDMLGNVWEWCWDLYDEATYGPYRVFRGGSWAESARGCGATARRRGHPSFRIEDLGFRLARTLG